jgi:hypothetical protein
MWYWWPSGSPESDETGGELGLYVHLERKGGTGGTGTGDR